jgi:alpha-L-rhamnosidase
MKAVIRKYLLLALIALLIVPPTATTASNQETIQLAGIQVAKTTTEYTEKPLGLDVKKPRLSWVLQSDERGQKQTAYQILVASSQEKLNNEQGDIWDSGKVDSDQSVNITYAGKALESAERYYWKVRVWDIDGEASAWSSPTWWEMGLLNQEDWKAQWINGKGASSINNPSQDYPARLNSGQTLGQTFTMEAPFKTVAGRFPTWNTVGADMTLTLYKDGPNGEVLQRKQVLDVVDNDWVALEFEQELPAGTYYFEISAPVGIIGWWSHSGDVLKGGQAYADGKPVNGDRTLQVGKPSENTPATYLRNEFTIEKEVKQARLYSTALGIYEPHLNGKQVGKDLFAPGWTDYKDRVQYQTYDVTKLVKEGKNALGAILGDGWYSGYLAHLPPDVYGSVTSLLMQLEIEYSDGSTEVIVTDNSWKMAEGPIVSQDMLMGETYDARQEIPGWDKSGFEDSDWSAVKVRSDGVEAKLVAQSDPPVQVIEEIKPVKLTEPKPGVFIFDLGQNMVGDVRLKVQGDAGTKVTLRHGEALNPDGTLYTGNLRSAKATDYYILKGDGEEVYEPTFTFHGFRYVEVTGFPGTPTLETITGRVMHSALPFTGTFETSNPMINQLQSNILWGQRGNFLSIPTDTPARDERMGWTGDINVFVDTSTFNMNVATFLGTKWLQDLRDAQFADGAFPNVAPDICCGGGAAGWGDAGITVPYAIWQRYGDIRAIEDNYSAMARWIVYLQNHSTNHIRPAEGFGDWLNDNDETPKDVIATAYYAYSAKLLAEMAAAIGKDQDAQKYQNLANDIKAAFNKAFVSEDGRVKGDTQTAYVLALYMDLIPTEKLKAASDRLVQLIESRNWHLSTGFLGTRDLLPVLTKTGHLDVAYRLLNNDTFPSWGYQIKNGATTMWEHWGSLRPDGTFSDPSMNSFNHYAYGAVGNWMYQNIAGLKPDNAKPGFKHFFIEPKPGGGLTSAKAGYDSVYGKIVSNWEITGDVFKLNVEIPVNTTATVSIPADNQWAVMEGNQSAADVAGVKFLAYEDNKAKFLVESGSYQFVSDPVVGKLGFVLNQSDELKALATKVEDKGIKNHLSTKLKKLDEQVLNGKTAYLAGEKETLMQQVQGGLVTAAQLQKWVSTQDKKLGTDTGKVMNEHLSNMIGALSSLSSTLYGVEVKLTENTYTAIPGNSFTVKAELTNNGKETINKVDFSLNVPEGWQAAASGQSSTGVVKPGETFTAAFDVTVPENQSPSDGIVIDAEARFKANGGTAIVPVVGLVTVEPPIAITALSAEKDTLEPGAATTVSATVKNRGKQEVSGEAQINLPVGWTAETPVTAYTLKADEEQTVKFTIATPVEATESKQNLDVIASYNGTVGDQESLSINLKFTNPPAASYDHVDAGVAASEQQHNLKASARSGTTVEAGLTRRYAQAGEANAYFQYDMKIEKGKPFIIRSIETFDGVQTKDYYVLVNGVKVHSRNYQSTGAGTVTYQFVVDDETLINNDVVTIRFQEDEGGRNHDPSIADVWTIPLN